MNKKVAFLGTVVLMLALLTCIYLSSCGSEKKTEITNTKETTGATETVQPTDAPEADIGVTDRSDFLNEDDAQSTEGQKELQDDPEEPEEPVTPGETQPVVPAETSPSDDEEMSYEKYISLSGKEQEAFINTFPSLGDFVDWFNEAKEQAEVLEPTVLEDDTINLG